jgi:SAM-dependent methyltransferase
LRLAVEDRRVKGKSYAALRGLRPPNALLIRALGYLHDTSGRALDVGAGALNETNLLLRTGLRVDAVDRDPVMLSFASRLNNPRLNVVCDDIRNFSIEPELYSLIAVINILPFLPRADLSRVLDSLIGGLSRDGILCCTLFSVDDSWAGEKPHMIFCDRSEAERLFWRLRTIEFSERVYDGFDAESRPKHWHIFRWILQK